MARHSGAVLQGVRWLGRFFLQVASHAPVGKPVSSFTVCACRFRCDGKVYRGEALGGVGSGADGSVGGELA